MQTRASGCTRDDYNAGARAPGNGPRAHPFALWMHLISHLFVRIAELAVTSPSYKRAAICRPIVNRPLRLDSRVINRGYRIRIYGEFMFTVAMRVFATAEEETSLLSRVGMNVKSVAAVDYSYYVVDNPFVSRFAKTEFYFYWRGLSSKETQRGGSAKWFGQQLINVSEVTNAVFSDLRCFRNFSLVYSSCIRFSVHFYPKLLYGF